MKVWIVSAIFLLAALPARAVESYPSVAAWEADLNAASQSGNFSRAAEIIVGPLLEQFQPGITDAVEKLLVDAFEKTGFSADTISVLSRAEKGERRVLALYSGTNYRFLFIVFHKRPEGWVVININAEGNYGAIREKF